MIVSWRTAVVAVLLVLLCPSHPETVLEASESNREEGKCRTVVEACVATEGADCAAHAMQEYRSALEVAREQGGGSAANPVEADAEDLNTCDAEHQLDEEWCGGTASSDHNLDRDTGSMIQREAVDEVGEESSEVSASRDRETPHDMESGSNSKGDDSILWLGPTKDSGGEEGTANGRTSDNERKVTADDNQLEDCGEEKCAVSEELVNPAMDKDRCIEEQVEVKREPEASKEAEESAQEDAAEMQNAHKQVQQEAPQNEMQEQESATMEPSDEEHHGEADVSDLDESEPACGAEELEALEGLVDGLLQLERQGDGESESNDEEVLPLSKWRERVLKTVQESSTPSRAIVRREGNADDQDVSARAQHPEEFDDEAAVSAQDDVVPSGLVMQVEEADDKIGETEDIGEGELESDGVAGRSGLAREEEEEEDLDEEAEVCGSAATESAMALPTPSASGAPSAGLAEVALEGIASDSGQLQPPPLKAPPKKTHERIRSSQAHKTGRFNYAGDSCGAKVLETNEGASDASSILTGAADRYMLNKCNREKYVVIELCEEVAVDAIEIANLEFFSSVPHTFDVYGAEEYPSDEWRLVGSFEAQSVRKGQYFQLPQDAVMRLHEFYRYVKVKFLTHYGQEHFCPITYVRVYGHTLVEGLKHEFDLNQLETQNLYEAISNIFLSGEDVAPHFHRLHGDDEDYDDLNPVIQELSDLTNELPVMDREDIGPDSPHSDLAKVEERAPAVSAAVSPPQQGSNQMDAPIKNVCFVQKQTFAELLGWSAFDGQCLARSTNKTQAASTSPQKMTNNVFKQLARKIKDLEINQSLSHFYLDDLSGRVRELRGAIRNVNKQLGVVARVINATNNRMEQMHRRDQAQSEELRNLRFQLAWVAGNQSMEIMRLYRDLQEEVGSHYRDMVLCVLVSVLVCVPTVTFLLVYGPVIRNHSRPRFSSLANAISSFSRPLISRRRFSAPFENVSTRSPSPVPEFARSPSPGEFIGSTTFTEERPRFDDVSPEFDGFQSITEACPDEVPVVSG